MKDTDKLFLVPLGLAWLISLIILLLMQFTIRGSISGDIEKVLVANLQLVGVLFGFVAALSVFLFRRVTSRYLRMTLAYATTAFISFFFSLVFSFTTLLNIKDTIQVFKLLPICFTLTAVITTIAFVVDITLRTIREKEESEKR